MYGNFLFQEKNSPKFQYSRWSWRSLSLYVYFFAFPWFRFSFITIFLYAIICFKSVKKCDFCPGQDSTFPRINSSNQLLIQTLTIQIMTHRKSSGFLSRPIFKLFERGLSSTRKEILWNNTRLALCQWDSVNKLALPTFSGYVWAKNRILVCLTVT